MTTSAPVHESIKQLEWLLGEWHSDDGSAKYPNTKPVTYSETVTFSQVGQPVINFQSYSHDGETKKPMHLESGFLRIQPDKRDKVSFLVAHNFGLTTIEEGDLNVRKISMVSTEVSSCQRPKSRKVAHVMKVERSFELVEDGTVLVQILNMETDTQRMQPHLYARYKKVI
ncbi:THAP4 (predicted) [Pycnogonum litorale]